MILELAIVLVLSQLFLGLFLWYQVKDLYRYPNIFGLPVVGNLINFYKALCFRSLDSLHSYLLDISDKVGNGIFFGYIKGKRSVVLSCPDIIEEISYNPNAVDKAPSVYGVVNPLIKGIFTYCHVDNEWKLRRKEFNNSLTRSLIDSQYSETFKRSAKDLAQVFLANQERLDLVYHCTMASINIVKETHCGVEKPLPENRRFYKTWNLILHGTSLIFSNPLVALLFSFTYKIFDIILEKKADMLLEQVGSSLKGQLNILKDPSAEPRYLPLSVVITLRNKNRKLDKFELKKQLYELLVAGSHTVSIILAGAFAFMAALPEIQEKVWKEQYEIFGTSNRDPNIDDIRKMFYLERFVKEILRHLSPTFIAKNTTGEVIVGGVTIPAGTDIYYLLGKIRMDPRFWKDPQLFDPEHNYEDKPKYANTAFGVGVRNCPGMYYARQELKIIISTVIRNCKLSSKQKFEDFRYESHLMPEIVNLMPIQVEQRIF